MKKPTNKNKLVVMENGLVPLFAKLSKMEKRSWRYKNGDQRIAYSVPCHIGVCVRATTPAYVPKIIRCPSKMILMDIPLYIWKFWVRPDDGDMALIDEKPGKPYVTKSFKIQAINCLSNTDN